MYAYIKGVLKEKAANFIIIETYGIGYKIFMSQSSIEKLVSLENEIKVYTHYHVREDEISLFGFQTNEELKMFEKLISVSGVGAKSALTILSNIEPADFALAIISNDTSRLVKLPGIGAKSAARIILELKDKLKNEEMIQLNSKTENGIISPDKTTNEAISALQVLGYTNRDIEEAIKNTKHQDNSVETIIKDCLKYFSKR